MGTIRNPQTDVSTADYTIGGDWEFDNILTYTSSLGFTNPTDIVDKAYVDSQVIGGANEDNIYYIGKHGNDIGNDGRNVGAAFLTVQKGIDTADAQLPTISNQYVVRINDGGTYSGFSMTSKPYINIEAAGANLETTGINPFEIGGNNSIVANSMTRNTIAGVIVEKTGGGNGYLKVNNIYGSVNTISAIKVTSGTLYAEVDSIIMPTTSSAINISNRIELKSKRIEGMIVFSSSGASANIITHDLTGNIILSTNCTLNIIILGTFTGNITAPSGCKIKMLVAERTAGYHDAYDPTADVDIEYLGVHDDPPNLLIGGDYSVNPRQAEPNGILSAVDGSYIADNTILVKDGGNIKVESPLVSTERDLALTTIVPIADKQFGIVIPIENKDSLALLSSTKASMSFRAKWSSSPTRTLKMALIAWTGTRESITRDVVATWQSGALNPILAANWIYENSPSTLSFSAADTFSTFKIENFDITTSTANNFAIFIWVNSATIGLGETLSISNVRCTASEFVGTFHPRSAAEEISLCQRYYVQSSPISAYSPASQGSYTIFKTAGASNPVFVGFNIIFPTTMVKIPTLYPYSTTSGTQNFIRNDTGAVDMQAYGAHESTVAAQIELASPHNSEANFSTQWVADAKL